MLCDADDGQHLCTFSQRRGRHMMCAIPCAAALRCRHMSGWLTVNKSHLPRSQEEFHDGRSIKVLRSAAASSQSRFGDVFLPLVCQRPWSVWEAEREDGKKSAHDRVTGERHWAAEGKAGISGLTHFSSCSSPSTNTLSTQWKQYVSGTTSAAAVFSRQCLSWICSNRSEWPHSQARVRGLKQLN